MINFPHDGGDALHHLLDIFKEVTTMADLISTTILRFIAMALFVCFLPGLAAAQAGTSVDDEGRIAYAASDPDMAEAATVETHALETPTVEAQHTRPMQPRAQVDEPPRVHWLWIVGRNAILGGAVGAVIGTGAYLLSGFEWSPMLIPQFTGGGILFGSAIGLIDVAFREDVFASRPASIDWMERDMPASFELRLFQKSF
jgi:hypothetical protein